MKKVSSKSSYNKISILLESIRSSKFDSKKELIEYMEELNQPIFHVKRYKPPPIDDMVLEFSQKSLGKVVRLCMALGLLDDNGITSIGKTATKRNNFDIVLSEQIIQVLKNNNIELKALNRIVNNFLKEKVPTLPTASEIFKQIQSNSEINYLFFSK